MEPMIFNWQGYVTSRDLRRVKHGSNLIVQIETYFTEIDLPGESKKYVPRSIQVDLEEGVTNRVRLSISDMYG